MMAISTLSNIVWDPPKGQSNNSEMGIEIEVIILEDGSRVPAITASDQQWDYAKQGIAIEHAEFLEKKLGGKIISYKSELNHHVN